MIDKIHHYSMNNPASVYDEEAMTALELAARTAGKVNECVDAVNDGEQKNEEFRNRTTAEIANNFKAQNDLIADMEREIVAQNELINSDVMARAKNLYVHSYTDLSGVAPFDADPVTVDGFNITIKEGVYFAPHKTFTKNTTTTVPMVAPASGVDVFYICIDRDGATAIKNVTELEHDDMIICTALVSTTTVKIYNNALFSGTRIYNPLNTKINNAIAENALVGYCAHGTISIDTKNKTIQVVEKLLIVVDGGTMVHKYVDVDANPVAYNVPAGYIGSIYLVNQSGNTYKLKMGIPSASDSVNGHPIISLGGFGYGKIYGDHFSPIVKFIVDGQHKTPDQMKYGNATEEYYNAVAPSEAHFFGVNIFDGDLGNLSTDYYDRDLIAMSDEGIYYDGDRKFSCEIDDDYALRFNIMNPNVYWGVKEQIAIEATYKDEDQIGQMMSKILLIGDSMIDNNYFPQALQNYIDGYIQCQMVGTRTNAGGVRHEGRGQWKWSDYNNSDSYAGKTNPFKNISFRKNKFLFIKSKCIARIR